MKKIWKVGMLSTLMLTPTAVVLADENTQADNSTQTGGTTQTPTTQDQQRAIDYFEKLNMSSSMADYNLYISVLDKGFTSDNKMYVLMKKKLDYIKTYKDLTLVAESLKTEISKLTLTNKTLIQNYDEAKKKYDTLLNQLEVLNTDLINAKNGVTDPAFNTDNMLKSLESYYKVLATDLVVELISANNQTTLATRGTQIENIKNSTYIDKVTAISNATTADSYIDKINDAKKVYATLTTEEKTIVDNQVIEGTSTSLKQVMTAADTNVSKAAAFDTSVASIASINITDANKDGIAQLKMQLVALDKSYNGLSSFQKLLITQNSKDLILPFQNILSVSAQIGALKADNTEAYRNKVSEIEKIISELQAVTVGNVNIPKETVKVIIPNIDKLEVAKKDIESVKVVEDAIKALSNTTTPDLAKIQAARKSYNELSTTLKKIVLADVLGQLTALENADKNAAAVDKKIDAITVSTKQDFYTRYADAKKAYDALNPTIAAPYVTQAARLNELAPYAEFVNKFNSLKSTDKDYANKLQELLEQLSANNSIWSDAAIDALSGVTADDKVQLKAVKKILEDRRSSTEKAIGLISDIDALENLGKNDPSKLLSEIVAYRTIYNELDKADKKLVTNIQKLTQYEKANKAAVDVMRLVDSLDPLDSKFTKTIVSARKNYDKLNNTLKPLIAASYSKLVEMEKISSVMIDIDNLKKSKNILEDAKKAETNYNNLLTYLTGQVGSESIINKLEKDYKPLIKTATDRYQAVVDITKQIDQMSLNINSSIGEVLKSIANLYKGLSSNDKKLVSNYKNFQEIEKNYKAGLKVYNLIEDLKEYKDSSDYSKKVEAAYKAYQKLKSTQKVYVFNYEDLQKVIGPASLIGEIDNLKPSMKDFASVVSTIRTQYEALNDTEKKQVYNYSKLVAAEEALKGAQNVITLIDKARPSVANYLDVLQAARDAYEKLSSDQKKQVTNYKELQNREKSVKPILTLNDDILKIGTQSTAKNFISKYEKAWKDLEKVNLQDRALLTNEKLLTETYMPLYNVMKQIESIKPSSNTFVDDVKAARAAYDALTSEQKAKILNLNNLKEHEVNVQGGAYVDSLIRALKSNPKNVYVQKVLEAEEAYKNLSSANKKAVTLYDELKVELKFIKPVVDAMEAIDQLSKSSSKIDTLVKKVNTTLAKLTDEQYALIPNIDKFNNLGNVIQTIGLIELIKPSDTKYYIGNTKAAEISYTRLSADEKQKVTNYSKLEEALINVAALEQITKKISELSKLSSTYADDVEILLVEYKKLPSALKKQVTNYSTLENAKKDIDAAAKVSKSIADIDSSLRTFESKVISARKAYEKLTDDQKALVTNLRLLMQYERELGL